MSYEHPLTVTIRIPEEEPRQSGIYSTKHPEASIAFCRFNKFETILVETICKDLNIKQGTFLRRCAIHVAEELEKLKNAYTQSTESRR